MPKNRLIVLLTFATAALVGVAIGRWEGKNTGETTLFLELLDRFRKNDVFVADRRSCTYWVCALLAGRGADVAMRMHAQRKYAFRKGKKLGPSDHIVSWDKPKKPEWMDQPMYDSLPQTLLMRELRYEIRTPGFRTKQVVMATTMTEAKEYREAELADLYHERRHVELDIRNIKTILGMERSHSKTPPMVRRKLWGFALGYDLIRRVMAHAASEKA